METRPQMDYIRLKQSGLVPESLRGYYLVYNDNHGFFRFNHMGGVRLPIPCSWVEDPRDASKFLDPWEAKSAASKCLRGTQVLVAKPREAGSPAPPIFETGYC